jgi:2-polyprenyl-3-methyl-5-hydroxy-6-metoxy-1,4-benzoquinol methylase
MNYVIDYYENYREENRLTTNNTRKIEYITTIKTFEACLPKTGKILDCASGPGIYSFYFAERGYEVTALDITPRHIEFINNELKNKPYSIHTGVNDATDLSRFDNNTFDVVLCMGPIYHITDEKQRQKCLDECNRILKPGGLLAVTYINRLCIFPHVATRNKKFLSIDLAQRLLSTGTIYHDDPDCFWTDTYYAMPEELENLLSNMNLDIVDHLASDGISLFLGEQVDSMDEEEFKVWCDYHYMVCREKNILGMSNHGLIIGKKSFGAV